MRSTSALPTVLLAAFVAVAAAVAGLPDPGLEIEPGRTALLITDPQNDFLSPKGVTWGVVGKSVTANQTVENIDALFKAAKAADMPVFVSPHYYYPTDHGWKFEGALEKLMHTIGMFDREGALSLKGFEGSGADWLQQYKKYISDGQTVVSNPHKVYGPETNDLVLQLRKRGIDKVILGGMSANLCVESHMRELLEQGFEVAVVTDATAAAIVEEGDGYASALVNFRFIANTVWATQEAVRKIADSKDATKLLSAAFEARKVVQVEVGDFHFKPGQAAPTHTHAAPAVGYVAKGEIIYQIEGQEEQLLREGDVFYEPVGPRILRFDNASPSEEAIFLDFNLEQVDEPFIVFEQPPSEAIDRRSLPTIDVEDRSVDQVDIYSRELPSNASADLKDIGPLLGLVAEGTIELRVAGEATKRIVEGGIFSIPAAGAPATIVNTSSDSSAKVITFNLR